MLNGRHGSAHDAHSIAGHARGRTGERLPPSTGLPTSVSWPSWRRPAAETTRSRRTAPRAGGPRSASNKRVLDNAPLARPRLRRGGAVEVLLLLRARSLVLETGYWGILDFALSDLLGPLLSLRRDRAAAVTFGAIRLADPGEAAHATAILRERLGVDFDELRARGASMPRHARS